jgi:hypothetical protein
MSQGCLCELINSGMADGSRPQVVCPRHPNNRSIRSWNLKADFFLLRRLADRFLTAMLWCFIIAFVIARVLVPEAHDALVIGLYGMLHVGPYVAGAILLVELIRKYLLKH